MVATRCVGGMSSEKTSPPTRAAPTTPIGESCLRSPPSNAAFHRSGTLDGRAISACTPETIMSLIRSTDCGKVCWITPLAGVKPRKPAVTYSSST